MGGQNPEHQGQNLHRDGFRDFREIKTRQKSKQVQHSTAHKTDILPTHPNSK